MCECRNNASLLVEKMRIVDKIGVNSQIVSYVVEWCCYYGIYLSCCGCKDKYCNIVFSDIRYLLNHWEPEACIFATRENEVKKLKWLVDNGANINTSVCNVAIYHKRLEILTFLLDRGVPLNKKSLKIMNKKYDREISRICTGYMYRMSLT